MESRKNRRSSILKSGNSVGPDGGSDGNLNLVNHHDMEKGDVGGSNVTARSKRVSFSHAPQVTEFANNTNSSSEGSSSKTTSLNTTTCGGEMDLTYMDQVKERNTRCDLNRTGLNAGQDMSICDTTSTNLVNPGRTQSSSNGGFAIPPTNGASGQQQNENLQQTMCEGLDMDISRIPDVQRIQQKANRSSVSNRTQIGAGMDMSIVDVDPETLPDSANPGRAQSSSNGGFAIPPNRNRHEVFTSTPRTPEGRIPELTLSSLEGDLEEETPGQSESEMATDLQQMAHKLAEQNQLIDSLFTKNVKLTDQLLAIESQLIDLRATVTALQGEKEDKKKKKINSDCKTLKVGGKYFFPV